jgi:Phage tail repeat like
MNDNHLTFIMTTPYYDIELLLDNKADKSILSTKASLMHSHTIDDITDLYQAISSKCELRHSHGISEIIGLQALLQSFAKVEHSHQLDDIPDAKEQLTQMNLQIDILMSQITSINNLISEMTK